MVSDKIKEQHQRILSKYLPEEFVPYVVDLILKNPLQFAIVNPRSTKLGDFRFGPSLSVPKITVNCDLNPYSFLVTTLHELAHYFTHLEYGNKIKAHGKEWQKSYQKLIYPVIETGHLPKDVETALLNSLISVKASSCSDVNLVRVLRVYDLKKTDVVHLEELAENDIFELSGKRFAKGKLRRKRYICSEIGTKKEYLVFPLAEVKLIKDER